MQATTSQYQDQYFGGQVTRSDAVLESTISEDAGNIKIEGLVLKGASKNGGVSPSSAFTFQEIKGVVIKEVNKPQTDGTQEINYVDGDAFTTIRKGYMALTLSGSVAKGGKLFYVHTAGGASALGTWRGDLDTNKASATPIIAQEAGVAGDVIEVLINCDMQIGVS